MFTYGDGISDVNIKKNFYNFIEKSKKILTVTAVRPQRGLERSSLIKI